MEKICIITDTYKPHTNGVVTTLENLVLNLKNREFETFLISQNLFKRFTVPFYKNIDLAINPWKIVDFIKIIKPDYIHIATEFGLGYCAAKFCQKNNLNYTSSYHTNWEIYIKNIIPKFPENIVFNYLKIIHGKSKKILVTNKEMKNKLSSKGFENLVIWSRGVDKNIFNPSKIKNLNFPRPILLTVSRISKEKNLEDFFNLNLPGTKIVVGDGPLLEYYKTKYPNIIFLGELKGEKLAEIYASSDVFVFPSKSDTFGLVMIEAMSCGIPVASYEITGPSEIIENKITGYKSTNLEESVKYCLTNLINKEAKKNIYEKSFKWDWKLVTDDFIKNLVKIEPPYPDFYI